MKQFQSKIAFTLVHLMFINSVVATGAFARDTVSATNAAATEHSAALLQDLKTLQASIDSGKVGSATAVDTFSQAIADHEISVDDVNAFVKTQMTSEQYKAFQDKINSSMRGIDPTTLTAQETGDIVGQALAGIHTEGLYWSGCATVWTGAAIIAAAVVTTVFAVVKSKSISSIQSSYQTKITGAQMLFVVRWSIEHGTKCSRCFLWPVPVTSRYTGAANPNFASCTFFTFRSGNWIYNAYLCVSGAKPAAHGFAGGKHHDFFRSTRLIFSR